MQDRGVYDPPALRGWRLFSGDGRWRWEVYGAAAAGKGEGGTSQKVLYEDVLGDLERKLLGTDPETCDYVLKGESRARR